jgi:ABC-2 type transport system ATP-binding protein
MLRPVSAISVTGLVKTFGTTRALDGLDLEVAAGEVHGFLGPNGASKPNIRGEGLRAVGA